MALMSMSSQRRPARAPLVAALALLAVASSALTAACSSENDSQKPGIGRVSSALLEWIEAPCAEGNNESLVAFAQKCTDATNSYVLPFDCEDGEIVPTTNLVGVYNPYSSVTSCDRPNGLNKTCDPGSRFQVLTQTEDVTVVAHCRKMGGKLKTATEPGTWGDVAVIQYNRKNGATCFYQIGPYPGEEEKYVSGVIPSPSNPAAGAVWRSPQQTANQGCVKCHDNGPFVRTPYLAQLGQDIFPNPLAPTVAIPPRGPQLRLPGTYDKPCGTTPGDCVTPNGAWEDRFSWNKREPYSFIGTDFQAWKAYSVLPPGGNGSCVSCHRMGMSSLGTTVVAGEIQPIYATGLGTSQDFGLIATASTQVQKNAHSAQSPIWMKPFPVNPDGLYDSSAHADAVAVEQCAKTIASGDPKPGCAAVRYAQGDTCAGGTIAATLNGEIESAATEAGVDSAIDLGVCASGADCPRGFCYWESLHGPFWQDDEGQISYARIAVVNNYFQGKVYATKSPGPRRTPGGKMGCALYSSVYNMPIPSGGTQVDWLVDKSQEVRDISDIQGYPVLPILSGFVGNVAQASVGDLPDYLRILPDGGGHSLAHFSLQTPDYFTGLAYTSQTPGWAPVYTVLNETVPIGSSSVELVPYPQSLNVYCYISGISGAWSVRDPEEPQPSVKIGFTVGKSIYMQVYPSSGPNRVNAFATCLRRR